MHLKKEDEMTAVYNKGVILKNGKAQILQQTGTINSWTDLTIGNITALDAIIERLKIVKEEMPRDRNEGYRKNVKFDDLEHIKSDINIVKQIDKDVYNVINELPYVIAKEANDEEDEFLLPKRNSRDNDEKAKTLTHVTNDEEAMEAKNDEEDEFLLPKRSSENNEKKAKTLTHTANDEETMESNGAKNDNEDESLHTRKSTKNKEDGIKTNINETKDDKYEAKPYTNKLDSTINMKKNYGLSLEDFPDNAHKSGNDFSTKNKQQGKEKRSTQNNTSLCFPTVKLLHCKAQINNTKNNFEDYNKYVQDLTDRSIRECIETSIYFRKVEPRYKTSQFYTLKKRGERRMKTHSKNLVKLSAIRISSKNLTTKKDDKNKKEAVKKRKSIEKKVKTKEQNDFEDVCKTFGIIKVDLSKYGKFAKEKKD